MKADVPTTLPILAQGAGWVALDKPSGSAPPESGPEARALLAAAGIAVEERSSWRTVARTERDASGVLIIAQADVHAAIMAQLADGSATREHEALVRAYVVEDECTIDLPLDYDKRAGRMRIRRNGGEPAITTIRVLERVAGHTLLSCVARPGLLHQVRVHLQSADYPLAVDPVYGGGEHVLLSEFKSDYRASSRHEERPLLSRLSLHIAQITFVDPATSETTKVCSERPKDIRAALTQLARCGAPRRGRGSARG